eukprot:TRINITY_DN13641_c0_g1_i1.p1 TRINITY_DN13641_c0_g1~~TRINITY_DN13641_c0_g1_i1.p1  ORF type:complete len:641 (+),score=252.65 TRINITY_DN13641_c0_g1_i1:202-2124(+)
MYTSKIKRDDKGNIIKGSVLSASDRVEKQMARIAPDRRWFGNTRVIGQESLQKFREEMGAKYRDPYSVIIKQSKLPLSLLEEPKFDPNAAPRQEMKWGDTFGDKSTRKRVRMAAVTMEDMAQHVVDRGDGYKEDKDRKLMSNMAKESAREDKSANQVLFRKGQSNRIWNELYKVVDSADVILYVLDARDPMGTRSPFLEEYMRKEKKYKHFVFVLNKCDLIPLWATARWLQILSKDFPTIAFHASVNHPFGKGNLISLLRQFNKLHNVTHRGDRRSKAPISVGIVGYPNVGKSSVINTLRRKSVCKVAPIPGETKVWQYVALTRSIFLIDCPGIVYDREGNNDVQAVLKGVVRVERLGSADKTIIVDTVLQIVKPRDITATYGITEWTDVINFLEQLATARGKLLPGGVPDVDGVSRQVLYDWQRGKLPWFNAPGFESNQQYRDAVGSTAEKHMKYIEQYHTFNIVDDRLERGDEPKPEEEVEEEESYEFTSDDEEGDEEDDVESVEGDDEEVEEVAPVVNNKGDKRSRKGDEAPAAPMTKKDAKAAQVAKKASSDLDKKYAMRQTKASQAAAEVSVADYLQIKDKEDRKQERVLKTLAQKKAQQQARDALGSAIGAGRSGTANPEEDALWDQFMSSAAQ